MALLLNQTAQPVPQFSALKLSSGPASLRILEEDQGALTSVVACLIDALASVDKTTRTQIETALVQLGLSQKSQQAEALSQLALQAAAQGLLHENAVVSGTCAMVLIRVGQWAKPFVDALPASHWAVDFVRQELKVA